MSVARAVALACGVVVAACAGPGPTVVETASSPAPAVSGPPGTVGPPVTAVTPVTPASSAPAAPRSFTLAFTGDLLLHQRVNAVAAANATGEPDRAYDYASLLERIGPLIGAADWAVCHMEVPLSADNTRLHPYPTFRVPGDIARDAAAIGYDACTTASNHALDQGPAGLIETLDVLDAAGLRHTGSARSEGEASQPLLVEVAGVPVAFLAYAYGFNSFAVPSGSPWMVNRIDEDAILADAAAARRRGARFVVVSLHWGEQYQSTPDRQQRDLGPRLLASPAIDLIVGHHAHVVQPIDRIDGEWLVYGMGNLLSASTGQVRRDELLVQVTVTVSGSGAVTSELNAVPLYLDRSSLVVHPSSPALRGSDIDAGLAAELDASEARVRSVLQTGSGWSALTIG